MSSILIVKENFENLKAATYSLERAKQAIDTPYIFWANSVQDFVRQFTEIQLSRGFNPGYSRIDMSLKFDEESMLFAYESTSGTQVYLEVFFDLQMQEKSCELSVYLPEDRVCSNGGHFGALTQRFQRHDWDRFIEASNGKKIRVVKRKADRPYGLYNTVPLWVFNEISNRSFLDDPKRANHVFAKYGFKPVDLPFFKWAWEGEDQYIAANARLEVDFSIFSKRLREFPEGKFSFRKICEILREESQRLKKKASEISEAPQEHNECEEEEYEDYDLCDEFDEFDE